MGTFKYRESIDSPWKELPVIGDIYTQDVRPPEPETGGGGFSDIWYNGNVINTANHQYYLFDVSNYNTLSLTYDYIPSDSKNYISKFSAKAYYGYGVKLSSNSTAIKPTTFAVDGGAKSESLCSLLSTAVSGTTITLDVSDYTTFVLDLYTSYTTASTDNYCAAHFYNIALS